MTLCLLVTFYLFCLLSLIPQTQYYFPHSFSLLPSICQEQRSEWLLIGMNRTPWFRQMFKSRKYWCTGDSSYKRFSRESHEFAGCGRHKWDDEDIVLQKQPRTFDNPSKCRLLHKSNWDRVENIISILDLSPWCSKTQRRRWWNNVFIRVDFVASLLWRCLKSEEEMICDHSHNWTELWSQLSAAEKVAVPLCFYWTFLCSSQKRLHASRFQTEELPWRLKVRSKQWPVSTVTTVKTQTAIHKTV
jgi:hypothetical protein